MTTVTATKVNSNHHTDTLNALLKCVGADAVQQGETEREYYSQDYYRAGELALAIVSPSSVEELTKVVSIATDAGLAIFPRGAGLSYSDGYLPNTPDSIVVDTSKLNSIVEINEEDMYVTVETGCTWAALEEALSKTEVRPGFWGTLSGLNATIGGSISQGAASLGSAKFGTSSESVLAMDIVVADGSVVSTGSAGQVGKQPFFRNYGPDTTGIFCADCGALGIKARITLRLERRRALSYGLSFGYSSFEKMMQGIAAVAREGRATEHLSFSAETMANFGELSFSETLKTAYRVASTSSNPLNGLIQVAKMGLAGKRFLDKAKYMSHCVVEAGNQKELAGQIALLRKVVEPCGFDLPNTVPTVIRAYPFGPTDVMSPDGRRLMPIHAIFPMSKVVEFHRSLQDYYQGIADDMSKHGITQQPILGTMGTTGFMYEPVYYWHDKPAAYHLRNTSDEILAKAADAPDNIDAREFVEKIRIDVTNLMHQFGGVHMQIGKMYPYLQDRTPESIALIKSIKKQLDPKGLINPGALGLR